jgi:hypothetical protein
MNAFADKNHLVKRVQNPDQALVVDFPSFQGIIIPDICYYMIADYNVNAREPRFKCLPCSALL